MLHKLFGRPKVQSDLALDTWSGYAGMTLGCQVLLFHFYFDSRLCLFQFSSIKFKAASCLLHVSDLRSHPTHQTSSKSFIGLHVSDVT